MPKLECGVKNLFEEARVAEIKTRLAQLGTDSSRHWGKMSAAQAVAHCCGSLEMALGDWVPPKMFVGRIMGAMIKPLVLRDDEPLRRNTPSIKPLIIADDRNLAAERARLCGLIDRFVGLGPNGFRTHPHSFFGAMTPAEWSILMYKHLDHHLRQFGV